MDHRVAIIGGGISGLSAGHHLAESGLKPVVFESESFVGGRMSSERVNGFTIDKGAYTLPESYRNLRRFVDRLGIGSLVQTPGTSSIFAEGAEHPFQVGSPGDFLRIKPLSLKSKKGVVRLFLRPSCAKGPAGLSFLHPMSRYPLKSSRSWTFSFPSSQKTFFL